VIVGAMVVATKVDTGISQSTVTSKAGTFVIPNLIVETYRSGLTHLALHIRASRA